jgi:hypothetical protein
LARAGTPGKANFFVTTAYEPNESGVLRAVLPARCVFVTTAEPCSLYVDHYRARKTGPRFPVAIAGCSVHRLGRFTLYPPGHFPYGRAPAVACSVSGPPFCDGATGQPAWEASVFAAAVDAAAEKRWRSDSAWDDPRRRRTQGRRLQLCGRLVGIDPVIDEGTRERIATQLGVSAMILRAGARGFARSWASRGAAIVTVLLALVIDGALPDRILAAGAVGGLWPPPWRWDAVRRTWLRSGRMEQRVASPVRVRAPPPTNLRGAKQPEAD